MLQKIRLKCYAILQIFFPNIALGPKCDECHHPESWHYMAKEDSVPYCWNRRKGYLCDCGYHQGR